MAFDSVQVRFKGTPQVNSPFANTRVVPFVDSYFEVLRSVVDDIKTEYFWLFASFVNMNTGNFLDYIPEQHEKDQVHVWYTTHPMGGLNKEGNVFLIPTKKFKEQMHDLKFLRDFKDINYHADPDLYQRPITKCYFDLKDPYTAYRSDNQFYKWLINVDLQNTKMPNYYPSFWEDEKLYTWGKTNDVLLAPHRDKLEQFYDIDRSLHFEMEYEVKPMDIIFISYDEPSAEKRYNTLKEKFPRAKWSKGVQGQTLAYASAALMSETDYFFAKIWY